MVSDDALRVSEPPTEFCDQDIHAWFELSYAHFLTIPRSVMQEMPADWQHRMAECLEELDATYDWRPKDGSYWVTLRRYDGRYDSAPLSNYRHGWHEVDELKRPDEYRENRMADWHKWHRKDANHLG